VSARAGNRDTRPSSDGDSFSFPRTLRLLRHADFERVYQLGRRHFSAHLTAFYLRRESGEGLRVGFTVGRVLGGAVHRNRMKRRLREAVRLCRPKNMVAVDVVINPKKSLLTAEFENVLQEVARAFDTIGEKTGNQVRERKAVKRTRMGEPS
jgi:ribonuclease P protein component